MNNKEQLVEYDFEIITFMIKFIYLNMGNA